jgi:hypothetical protein
VSSLAAGLSPTIDFSSEFRGLYPLFKNMQAIARAARRMVLIEKPLVIGGYRWCAWPFDSSNDRLPGFLPAGAD